LAGEPNPADGQGASSKMIQAKKLGVKIISEAEFLKLIN